MTDLLEKWIPEDLPDEEQEKPLKPLVETVRMFFTNKAAVVGIAVLTLIVFLGLFGSILVPGDPFEMVASPLSGPSWDHLLGTDYLGRDVFIGIIHGARPTLAIAVVSTVSTIVIGVVIGALSGFYGGRIDNLLMRLTEFFQVLPSIVLAMVVVAVFTPGLITLVAAIGITHWTGLARLTRAEFLKIKEREFVLAGRAVGAHNASLIWRVILPNALPPLIIAMTLMVGICILFEASLSFLGLNDPGIMTWGLMIGLSRDFFFEAWWTVAFPGLSILITVLSIALVGDGLNDALNPKLRGS